MHKTATTFLQTEIFPNLKDVNFIHNFELGSKLYEDKINIISNESFSGNSYHPFRDAEERYIKADRLKAMFPDAYILIGKREHSSWLKSLYSQYLKRRGILKFEDWEASIDPLYFDVHTYIRYLEKLFGKKKTYLYHFEDLKKNHHKFVLGICAFLDRDVPEYENKVFQRSFTDFQKSGMRVINKVMRSRQNKNGFFPFEAFRFFIDLVRKTDNPKGLKNK